MPNEFVQPVHSLGEAGDPGVSPMGDVPQFLYDRGFVGILAAAARHLREDIAVGTESVGLPAWGPGRVGLISRLLDGPLSQIEVAKFMQISPPSAMQLVKRLEHEGYVHRERDPKDGRRLLVSLTPTTRELAIAMRRRLVEQMNFAEAELAEQGFTPEDMDRCKALLKAFIAVDREKFRAGLDAGQGAAPVQTRASA